MKLKLKGFEIEGSVEEVKKLIELEEKKVYMEEKLYIPRKKIIKTVLIPLKKQRPLKYVKANPLTDKRVVRMKFITSKIKNIMYNDIGMSYEKAFSIASDEYKYKYKNQIKNYISVCFPLFDSVKLELNEILKGVIERVIKTKGKITFINDAYVLGIENIKDWHNFIKEILLKSQDISNYFKVNNNFKIINISEIIYE